MMRVWLMMVVITLFTGSCNDGSGDEMSADSYASKDPLGSIEGAADIEQSSMQIGVRNYAQIDGTLNKLFTKTSKGAVENVLFEVGSLLPADNNLIGFNMMTQIGMFELTTTYCELLFKDWVDYEGGSKPETSLRSELFPEIDFDDPYTPVSEVFAKEHREVFVDRLVEIFWRRGMALGTTDSLKEEKKNISTFIAEAIGEVESKDRVYLPQDEEGKPPQKILTSSVDVLMHVCVAMLSSAHIMFH